MIYIYANKPYTCRIKYRHIASYTSMKWMQLASEPLASTISKKRRHPSEQVYRGRQWVEKSRCPQSGRHTSHVAAMWCQWEN